MKSGLQEKVILGLLALLIVGGGFWRVIESGNSKSGFIEAGFSRQHENIDEQPVDEVKLITIHLVGAVNNPGIYRLPAGSRVYELLELAGGCNEDADYENINQARPLMDGEQIQVKLCGEETRPVNTVSAVQPKININQATAEELTALPGIGETRAGQIVAHREKNGFFTDPRELMDVNGIGEKTYANIADLITIY
jgi:competence protein ComEA